MNGEVNGGRNAMNGEVNGGRNAMNGEVNGGRNAMRKREEQSGGRKKNKRMNEEWMNGKMNE